MTAGIYSGIGSSAYTEAADEFTSASDIVNGYIDAASEQGIDTTRCRGT